MANSRWYLLLHVVRRALRWWEVGGLSISSELETDQHVPGRESVACRVHRYCIDISITQSVPTCRPCSAHTVEHKAMAITAAFRGEDDLLVLACTGSIVMYEYEGVLVQVLGHRQLYCVRRTEKRKVRSTPYKPRLLTP